MFLETARGKYVGFILALGVSDLSRSLEVIRGHMLTSTEPRHVIPFCRALEVSMDKSIKL